MRKNKNKEYIILQLLNHSYIHRKAVRPLPPAIAFSWVIWERQPAHCIYQLSKDFLWFLWLQFYQVLVYVCKINDMKSSSLLLLLASTLSYNWNHVFNKLCVIIWPSVCSRRLTYTSLLVQFPTDSSLLIQLWSFVLALLSLKSLLLCLSPVEYFHIPSQPSFSQSTHYISLVFLSMIGSQFILSESLHLFRHIGGSRSNDVQWIHLSFPSSYHLLLVPSELVNLHWRICTDCKSLLSQPWFFALLNFISLLLLQSPRSSKYSTIVFQSPVLIEPQQIYLKSYYVLCQVY